LQREIVVQKPCLLRQLIAVATKMVEYIQFYYAIRLGNKSYNRKYRLHALRDINSEKSPNKN